MTGTPHIFALVGIFDDGKIISLPPPWFVPVEAPACNDHLTVPAAGTADGVEQHFYCDRLKDHDDDKHRYVYDVNDGTALQWERR